MKHTKFVLAIVLLTAILLCGCTPSKADLPTQEQILQDLMAGNRDFRDANLELTGQTITLVEQDKDSGTARYSVSYAAESPEVSYFGEMTLLYRTDKHGCVLENAIRTQDYYAAKQECSPEIPEAYLRQEYGDMQAEITMLNLESLQDNEDTFTFQVDGRENPVLTWRDLWTIQCSYDLRDGWQVTDSEGRKTAETWDLCGVYTLENQDLSATVNISQFDVNIAQNQAQVVLEYSLTSHIGHDDLYGGPVMQQGTTYTSDGPQTVTCSLGYDHEYAVIEIGDMVSLQLCGRYVSWDPIGEGLGVWIKIKGRYANDYGCFWLNRT